jgi:chromosome segregation ATPase
MLKLLVTLVNTIYKDLSVIKLLSDNTAFLIVDNELMSRLRQESQDLLASIQQADVIIKEYQVEEDGFKRRIQELKHQKEDLQSRKRDIQMKVQNYNKMLFRVDQAKAELVELLKKPELYLEEIKKLEEEVVELRAAQADHLKNYMMSLKKYVEFYENRNIYNLQNIHATAKFEAIRVYSKDQDTKLRDAEKFLAEAKKQQALAMREAQHCMGLCRNAGENLDDELRPRFEEILQSWKDGTIEETLDGLEQKIKEEEGRADAIRFANPNAMKHYEERKTEVITLN